MNTRTTKTIDVSAVGDWCKQCESVARAKEQLRQAFVLGGRFGYVQFRGCFADSIVLSGELWELSF